MNAPSHDGLRLSSPHRGCGFSLHTSHTPHTHTRHHTHITHVPCTCIIGGEGWEKEEEVGVELTVVFTFCTCCVTFLSSGIVPRPLSVSNRPMTVMPCPQWQQQQRTHSISLDGRSYLDSQRMVQSIAQYTPELLAVLSGVV